ncbi:uncharacterized protein AruCF_3281 [Achromobacter ruhlandii]|nr:uncharacterized protein AruCF_3281 [Achromobacter ruhlandii]
MIGRGAHEGDLAITDTDLNVAGSDGPREPFCQISNNIPTKLHNCRATRAGPPSRRVLAPGQTRPRTAAGPARACG